MEHEKSSNSYAIAISIVASALILSGVIWVSANGITSSVYELNSAMKSLPTNTGGSGSGDSLATPTPGPKTFNLSDTAMQGNADAPITIVEFSDFQCPYCRRFYNDAYPQVVKDYVETGKAKIYFKHFPLIQIHPQAQNSAEAAECARDQGKFWEMHDKIFDEQQKIEPSGNTATYSADDLKKWAKDMGLNAATFNSCLDNGDKTALVQADMNEGISAGVKGTPTFYVNGQELIGAQPYSAFKQVIDAELANA